jgi:hypothetical protein
MWDWLTAHSFEIALASGIMLAIGVVVVPWIVLRMPVDALQRDNPLKTYRQRHPVLRALLFVARNAIGLPLLILGVVMLVAPGQGVLTILLALGIMEFPGKWRLEHAIVERPTVYRTLNWIRRKGHKTEFLPPRRA